MWEIMNIIMIYGYFSTIVLELVCWIMCFISVINSFLLEKFSPGTHTPNMTS